MLNLKQNFYFRQRKLRIIGLHAFILAMLITCVLSILKDIQDPGGFPVHDPAKIFHNHIITSFMMALAAYLSGLFLIRLFLFLIHLTHS